MIKKLIRRLTQTQMIVIGFCLVILTGTLLLMLPVSTREGIVTPPVNALFTAVSASCVTGLVIADTYQYWSMFGQCVILLLIQIGGLGFMTIGVFFAIVLRKKIGLWVRGTLQESVNIMQTGGIVRLAKKIIIGTAVIEGLGALILAARFSRTMEAGQAVYYGIFHSISAFLQCRVRSDGEEWGIHFSDGIFGRLGREYRDHAAHHHRRHRILYLE